MDERQKLYKRRLEMAEHMKPYQKPEVVQVNLVPGEAVLEVCKNHENAGDVASDLSNCSWPAGVGGGNCRGVTGS